MRNCTSDSQFTVPRTGGPGSTWTEPWSFPMPESGVLVAAGAHLHGGGMKLALDDVTCATSLFTSRST